MDHQLDLVLTLAGALTAALLFGLLAWRVRLSPIVGYLMAGVVVGPFTPGFVAHRVIASQFAELGVVLLMFGVGLNLHLRELLAVKRVAVPGAALAMGMAIAAGLLITHGFGWTFSSGLVYGIAISVASTVVLLRVFGDHQLLHTSTGHIAVGWLLLEDLFVVLAVVLLPLFTGSHGEGAGREDLLVAIGVAVAKIASLVAFTWIVGRKAIPRILGYIARTRSRELFTLAVLVIALGVAVGAATLFGASMALGAFLAGLVVGQSHFSARAASEALPMRDAFAVLFFVATGMLLDPYQLIPNLPLTFLTIVAVLCAKPLVALLTVVFFGYPIKTAILLAVGLGQIGEFSFMVSALGIKLGVLPHAATQSLVVASIVTITLNPILLKFSERASKHLGGWFPKRGQAEAKMAINESLRSIDASFRSVVVGYGPIGQNLVRLLRENGLEPTIIDMNHETVAFLSQHPMNAIYGDASQREILTRAGVEKAGSLIFTASTSSEEVIRVAKELNPNLLILARSTYLREAATLRQAGATEVVSSEGEVALAMAERLLRQLGATAEQLDKARDRVRRDVRELSGDSTHEEGST